MNNAAPTIAQIRAMLQHVPEAERPSAGLVLWHMEASARSAAEVIRSLGIEPASEQPRPRIPPQPDGQLNPAVDAPSRPGAKPSAGTLVDAGHLASGDVFAFQRSLWCVVCHRGGRVVAIEATPGRRKTRTLRLDPSRTVVVHTPTPEP